MGSLDGIRVVEIGTSFAGPFAGQILGDLGAEVIKVERPDGGDDSRGWIPPQWAEHGVVFLALNRNKSSIALDYRSEGGREALRRLIASADVVLHNLRPGALERAGFGPDAIRALNSDIINCEISGYGPRGPRAGHPAYDPLVQAYSGIVSITGEEGRPPVRVPVALLDKSTGMWAALSTLEALRRRDLGGGGCHIELSLLQTAMMWLNPALMGLAAGAPAPERFGSGMANVVPYGAFPASDGDVFISAGNQGHWLRLCSTLDGDALTIDRRFVDNESRIGNRRATNAEIAALTSRLTVDEIITRLETAHVPCAPVNTLDEILTDEQVIATGMIQAAEHPSIPEFSIVNLPATFDSRYAEYRTAPPLLGEQSTAVLKSLGYDMGEITRLVEAGAIKDGAE